MQAELDRLHPVGRLGGDHHPGRALEHVAHDAAGERVVVGDDHAQPLGGALLRERADAVDGRRRRDVRHSPFPYVQIVLLLVHVEPPSPHVNRCRRYAMSAAQSLHNSYLSTVPGPGGFRPRWQVRDARRRVPAAPNERGVAPAPGHRACLPGATAGIRPLRAHRTCKELVS